MYTCELCQKNIKNIKLHNLTQRHLLWQQVHSNKTHYLTRDNILLKKSYTDLFKNTQNNDIKNFLIEQIKEKHLINIIDSFIPKNETYIDIYNKTTLSNLRHVLYAFKMYQIDNKAHIIERLISHKIFLTKSQILTLRR